MARPRVTFAHDGSGIFAGWLLSFDVRCAAEGGGPDNGQRPEAVEHRDRPMWGPQFHSESVLTRHGHELLANFTRPRGTRQAERERVAAAPPAPPTAQSTAAYAEPEPCPPTRSLRILCESLTGASDLGVVIRVVLVTPGRIHHGVGGVVMALSDPAAEHVETVVKFVPPPTPADRSFPGRRADSTPV